MPLAPIGPVWIASPPEVHSASLSSGPGPGALLAAAGAWSSLSTEYASVAEELTTVLGAVQSGAWDGASAETYVAAHSPYLAWLTQASADSAGTAAQHEVAAAAYSTALAVMPTLPELALNHTIHGVLTATNFFGVNTIPIALNEADYVRMWIQAATAMGTYQTVSGAALASAPRTTAAPVVLKTNTASAAEPPRSSGNFFADLYNQLVELIEHPGQVIPAIIANPSAWFPLLFFIGYEAFFIPFGTTFWSVLLSSPALVLPIAINAGLGYLATLGGQQPAPVGAPAPVPMAAGSERLNPMPAGLAPGVGVPAGTPAPAGAAASGAPGAPAPAPPALAYAVGGVYADDPPGPALTDRDHDKAPAEAVPAAAAAARAPSREQSRARRRRRTAMKGFADEFMDMNSEPENRAAAAASERGAGPLGFTGTAHKAGARAAGLATLAGDEFGGSPRMPLVPDTWGDEPEGEGDAAEQS
jgi:PPE-repeat protein